MNPNTQTPRQNVLILSHHDSFIEVFAERNTDVHIARVPQGFTLEGERQADQIAEGRLPRRYRQLWRADRLRATGSTHPLLPSTLADSQSINELLTAFNSDEQHGVMIWT